ncbi:phage filamentation protein Fil family protein [Enterobacter sichuanensis]|uniref:phage filamentation protein Fil family protein n=1 Tax=Enterobacter sichuanensis TaxID=2071710 RepID=UPI0037529B95
MLVRQSPAMHYDHCWIHLPGGKKWHPCIELSPRQQAVRGIGKKRLLQLLSINVAGNLQTRRKVFPGS